MFSGERKDQVRFNSLIATSLVTAALVAPAQAGVIYGFDSITNNNPGDVFIGEAQLQLEVEDAGAGMADMWLRNLGPEASSIANVYFDGDLMTGIMSLDNTDPGVAFAEGGSPGNLPAGKTIDFDADFLAAALNPKPSNGVNPDEQVGVRVSYTGSFADLIGAIDSDEFRVGLHVIAFASGGSESFVTPAPGALSLLALAGLAGRRRRRD